MGFFFRPNPSVNYNFVVGVYVLGVLLTIILYALQEFNVEWCRGWWLIPSPFIVGLPYFVLVRRNAIVDKTD